MSMSEVEVTPEFYKMACNLGKVRLKKNTRKMENNNVKEYLNIIIQFKFLF